MYQLSAELVMEILKEPNNYSYLFYLRIIPDKLIFFLYHTECWPFTTLSAGISSRVGKNTRGNGIPFIPQSTIKYCPTYYKVTFDNFSLFFNFNVVFISLPMKSLAHVMQRWSMEMAIMTGTVVLKLLTILTESRGAPYMGFHVFTKY